VTTAIFAPNAALSGSRGAPLLPSARVFGLLASLTFHAGVGCYAYQHAAHEPAKRAALEVSRSAIEISIVTSTEPAPIIEVAPHAEANAHAPAAVRAAPVAKSAASLARETINTAAPTDHAAAVSSAEAGASVTPRFTLQAPVVMAGISAPSVANSQAVANAVATPATAAAPVPEAQVDTPAQLQAGSPPSYTAAAEAAGIEAELPLEVVIDAGGSVQSARALEHVGYGLDEAALAAIRRYRFRAARRAGNAVAVRMRWVLRFQLR
jgi:periplasmic protein TonB